MLNNDKDSNNNSINRPGIIAIFLTFFKIGTVGFGGGPALISIIKQEIVDKKKWISEDYFVQGIAVSLLPPGSMMVNIAFFTGGILKGFRGSMSALLGILLPSFIIMIILAALLVSFPGLALEDTAVRGLRPAVIGVLFALVLRMSVQNIRKRWGYALVIVSASLMFFWGVAPYFIIITALLLGVAYWLHEERTKAPVTETIVCEHDQEVPFCLVKQIEKNGRIPLEGSENEGESEVEKEWK
jgi:chromate transporter